MKPILFSENATTFTTNGLGRLDCISCLVTEERNGMFELEMEIAETAEHADAIEMSSIIVAKPSDGANNQPFRVYKITKPINGKFKVYAQHISYQLSYVPVMPFTVTASSSACATALQGLKTNAAESCPFNFSTDVTTVSGFEISAPMPLRTCLGGVEGSILDQFGGEYEWDGYDVYLKSHRGVQNPTVTLRYGKNITDFNQEKNISETITGLCPFWKDSEGNNLVTLTEKVIESQYAANFPFNRTSVLDMSDNWENQPTENQLRLAATARLNASGVGIPKVSIKVSFVNLWDTEEYKEVAALQTVKLCDVINVQFEKYGINTTAKVVKTQYDVLAERYNSVEVGSIRTSLASTIQGNAEALNALNSKMANKFASYNNNVRQEIDNATAWLTDGNGYVVATKDASGNWKEILFMDDDDMEEAHNVLRINENGIGFSSSGVSGPYTQAWTLDGKMVIGGTNAPSITVYDSNQDVLFQINSSGMIWNAANSSLSANGTLTATNAVLSGSIESSRTASNVTYLTKIISGKIEFWWEQGNDTGNVASIEAKKLSSEGWTEMYIDCDKRLSVIADEIYIDNQNTNQDLFIDLTGDDDVHLKINGDLYVYRYSTSYKAYDGLVTLGDRTCRFVKGVLVSING